jgi:hypothetical protein
MTRHRRHPHAPAHRFCTGQVTLFVGSVLIAWDFGQPLVASKHDQLVQSFRFSAGASLPDYLQL